MDGSDDLPLTEGWEKRCDEDTNAIFYYNTITGESTWDAPTSLSDYLQETIQDNENKLYLCAETTETRLARDGPNNNDGAFLINPDTSSDKGIKEESFKSDTKNDGTEIDIGVSIGKDEDQHIGSDNVGLEGSTPFGESNEISCYGKEETGQWVEEANLDRLPQMDTMSSENSILSTPPELNIANRDVEIENVEILPADEVPHEDQDYLGSEENEFSQQYEDDYYIFEETDATSEQEASIIDYAQKKDGQEVLGEGYAMRQNLASESEGVLVYDSAIADTVNREVAAVTIQCLTRCFLARCRVSKRKEELQRDKLLQGQETTKRATFGNEQYQMTNQNGKNVDINNDDEGESNQKYTTEGKETTFMRTEDAVQRTQEALDDEQQPKLAIDELSSYENIIEQYSSSFTSEDEMVFTDDKVIESPPDTISPTIMPEIKTEQLQHISVTVQSSTSRKSFASPSARNSHRSCQSSTRAFESYTTPSRIPSILDISNYFQSPSQKAALNSKPDQTKTFIQPAPSVYSTYGAFYTRPTLSKHQSSIVGTTEVSRLAEISQLSLEQKREDKEDDASKQIEKYKRIYEEAKQKDREKRQAIEEKQKLEQLLRTEQFFTQSEDNLQFETIFECLERTTKFSPNVEDLLVSKIEELTRLPDGWKDQTRLDRQRVYETHFERLEEEKNKLGSMMERLPMSDDSKENPSTKYLQNRMEEVTRAIKYISERIRRSDQLESIRSNRFTQAYGCVAGDSILHLAAWRGCQIVVEKLLMTGWDPNLVNNSISRSTPLHEAVRSGYIGIVRLLVQFGARVDAIDHAQDSSLHIAARCRWTPIVKLLLEAAVRPNHFSNKPILKCSVLKFLHLRNGKHKRAIDLAKLTSTRECLLDFERKVGADPTQRTSKRKSQCQADEIEPVAYRRRARVNIIPIKTNKAVR